MKSPVLIKLSSWLANKVYKSAEKIITLTPGIADLIIEKGINKNKIYCIPTGFNEEEFLDSDIDKNVRLENGWENKFIVMYTGSHATSDNLDTMVKAAEYLKDNSNILFISYGEGDKRQGLMKYCDDKQLNNIKFLGLIPRTQVPSALYASDITIMCLKKGEHWKIFLQNKFFDYLGAKKPIIAALEGTQSEMILDYNAGVSVEPENYIELAEKILELSNNREYCLEMGQNGYNFVNKFFNRNNLLDFYLELINTEELLTHESIIYKYSKYKSN